MRKLLFILFAISMMDWAHGQSQLPDIVLYGIDGKEVKSNSIIQGKPFAICFWAVWNKTSLLELNTLMEKYKDWHDQYGVQLYAISIDEEERIPRAKAYVDAHEWKYNVLFDQDGKLEHKMEIYGVPHLMLFNADGNVVWQEHSYHAGLEDTFLEEVHKLK